MKKLSHDPIRALLNATTVVADRNEQGIDGRVVMCGNSNSKIGEEYRMLQTHLHSLEKDRQFKSIMITSSVEDEGKTITCCNLAVLLSADVKKKVALVDCDMRKPFLHKMLNIKQSPGFCDILSGKCEVSDFMKTPTIGNVFVIPAGDVSLHPSEVLRNPAIKTIFDTLASSFDYVVIDTSPTLPVSDSRIIGALCDAVILVVRFDRVSKKSIKDAFSLLKAANAEPMGSILTDFRPQIYQRARYSYYY